MTLFRITISLVIILTCLTASLQAQTIVFVDPYAPGANNGTSWNDAYLSLRQALDGAASDTTLRVAEGLYTPGSAINDSFRLKTGVTLEGGYAGYGAPDPDARNIALYETILDGNDHNTHVVTGSQIDQTAVLDGFSITRGNAVGSDNDGCGGGMIILNGKPTVLNCSFTYNQADLGGGLYTSNSRPKISNCTFIGNIAELGGGMHNQDSNITLYKCAFTMNQATDGGGIQNIQGTYDLIECTFTENSAQQGGGINNSDSTLILTRSQLQHNSASYQGGGMSSVSMFPLTITFTSFKYNTSDNKAGGLFTTNYSGETIANCTFQGNTGKFGGGLNADLSHNLNMSECIFFGNQSVLRGAGIYTGGSISTFTHCVIKNNMTVEAGGGIYNIAGVANLIECDVIENYSGCIGGGVYNVFAGSTTLISQCNFKDNLAKEAGGGMYNNYTELITVNQCTFNGNVAKTDNGGGIKISNTGLAVINCLFNNNSAYLKGGGIDNANLDRQTSVTNCTFVNNTAEENGGGIANYDCNIEVKNCILWDNFPNQIFSTHILNTKVKYSCVQGGHGGIGHTNISDNPLFLNPAGDSFHLSWLSPCINRGTNEGAPAYDQDDDPRPSMGAIDLGMDEFTGTHALAANNFTLSQTLGGAINFDLQAEAVHAGHWYLLIGGMSGSMYGFSLPGGNVVLPVNLDGFSDTILSKLNTAVFHNFYHVLQGSGTGTASLNIPDGVIPPVWLGKKMHFAFAVDTYDFVSNPVEVEIVP